MSGYSETAVTLSAFPLERAAQALEAALVYLEVEWSFLPGKDPTPARLVFDTRTGELVQTLPTEERDIRRAVQNHSWVRLDGRVETPRSRHAVELMLHPFRASPGHACLSIRLDSRVYESIYVPERGLDDDDDDDESYFDEESMQDVIQLSLGLARVTEASGFLMQFFSGVEFLRQFDEAALRELLLNPSLSLRSKQPLLLAGARSTLVSRAEIEDAWGTTDSCKVMESVSGYVLLNLLDTRGIDSEDE
ncbi:hypothetical protein [Myxococcus landrumensis]|uniref:Uncharacterized protein n=1 Tax=Myxococcus landrumensis TaxID=2813577 RepID=A0ABX7N8N4_9BACT|nr:hypothetical protein [Myxococcus landrumus]QSQ15003.1 hypothetical protein JY572_02650 [Myxococcus landrumus]